MKTMVMLQIIVTTHMAPIMPITEVVEDNSPVEASKKFSVVCGKRLKLTAYDNISLDHYTAPP